MSCNGQCVEGKDDPSSAHVYDNLAAQLSDNEPVAETRGNSKSSEGHTYEHETEERGGSKSSDGHTDKHRTEARGDGETCERHKDKIGMGASGDVEICEENTGGQKVEERNIASDPELYLQTSARHDGVSSRRRSVDFDSKSSNHEGPRDSRSSHPGDKEVKKRSRQAAMVATLSVLLLQTVERVSYYSVMANMVLFCTSNLGYDTVNAATISQVFAGFVYLLPVLGGYLSDAHLGRFATILLSIILILLGVTLLIVSAINFTPWFGDDLSQSGKRAAFFIGLVLVAAGTGANKANISPFGAEQVEEMGEDAVNSFFNWFYWATAVGSVLAYTAVTYIQQNVSFVYGYLAALVAMLVALIVFLAAKPTYITSKPQGSAMLIFFSVLREGLCRRGRPADVYTNGGKSSKYQTKLADDISRFPSKPKLLDKARRSYGGDHDDVTVDGVLSLVNVLPICALVIMFWAIFSQTQTSFFVQAVRMDVRVYGFIIPAAMLGSFTNLTIVLILPLLDRVVYPCMKKLGMPLNPFWRIGLGLLVSALAVVVAGIVEIFRKEVMKEPGGSHVQSLGGEQFVASGMSVFCQIPQFVLVGLAELFTGATSLEIGYTQAPQFLQGFLTGVFYAVSGIGYFLSMGFMLVVRQLTREDPWWDNEINEIKMENLMFLLAGFMLLDFFFYCLVTYSYSKKYDDAVAGGHRKSDKRKFSQ